MTLRMTDSPNVYRWAEKHRESEKKAKMRIYKLNETINGEEGYFATEELAVKAAKKWYRVYMDDEILDEDLPSIYSGMLDVSFADFWTKYCFLEEIDVVTDDA